MRKLFLLAAIVVILSTIPMPVSATDFVSFPYVVDSTHASDVSTSVVITLPLFKTGNLLISCLTVGDGVATETWPSGWTQIFSYTSFPFGECRLRVAKSGDPAKITVSIAALRVSVWMAYSFANFQDTGSVNGTFSKTAIGVSANPAPPASSFWPNTQSQLFIVFYAWQIGTVTNLNYPVTYVDNQLTDNNGNPFTGIGQAAATKQSLAKGDTPGTATISAVTNWFAATISLLAPSVPASTAFPTLLVLFYVLMLSLSLIGIRIPFSFILAGVAGVFATFEAFAFTGNIPFATLSGGIAILLILIGVIEQRIPRKRDER